MTFRLKVKDITVEVDTPEEFRSALAIMRVFEKKTNISRVPEDLTPVMPIPPMTEKIAFFYKHIHRTKSHMLTILHALYDSNTLTTTELKNILNVKSPLAVGGALSGITKSAEKYGLDGNDIILKKKEKASGEIRYQLTFSMREMIRTEKEKAM